MEGGYFLILISEKQLFFLAWKASHLFSVHTHTFTQTDTHIHTDTSLPTCSWGKLKIAHSISKRERREKGFPEIQMHPLPHC